MHVSASDLKQVGGFGLAGALVASAYSLFQVYAKQKTGQQLQVETCALQEDEYLFTLIQNLQNKFADQDKVAFIRTVDSIDQLVFLRTQLQAGNILPGLEDRVESYVLLKKAEENMSRLSDTMLIKKTHAREVIEVQQLAKKIFDQLETHVLAIMRLCKDV
jgi:hypothetical protein